MEADIFHKLYGSNRRQIPESSQNLYSKDPFLFDYVDRLRPPLTGLDFYTPPEPLNRSPIYSSDSNKQSHYNYPLSAANNFKSPSLSSFLEGKSRFDHQETKSLPIFSSNLISKDMMRPINYKGKSPSNSRLKDKTEYPMKLPELENKQLNESVSIESDQEETFREPPKIVEENNDLKNESTFSMIEMEKSSPAKSFEKSLKENEQVLTSNGEKNEKRENENEIENRKKKEKNEREEKKEKEKKGFEEEKNTNNSENKEKSRNVIVIVPYNSSVVHTIIITVTKTDYQEQPTTTIVNINREETTSFKDEIMDHQEYPTTKTTTIADIKKEETTVINEIIRNLQITTDKLAEHSTIAASEEYTDYSTKTTTYIKNNANKF